jgi:hypothetical protein
VAGVEANITNSSENEIIALALLAAFKIENISLSYAGGGGLRLEYYFKDKIMPSACLSLR